MSKMNDVRKLSLDQARKKLLELHRARMELVSEGKPEKVKGVKKDIARLNSHISALFQSQKTA